MEYLSGIKKEFKKFRVRRIFKENIEPEEILLDAQKTSEFNDQKLETPLKGKIFVTFFGIIVLALLVLLVQANHLQLFKGREYSVLAGKNRLRTFPILAPRGLIYDRNLNILVANLPRFHAWLTPQDLPKEREERETVVEQISFLLEVNPREINEKLSNFDFKTQERILIAENLSLDKIVAMESRKDEFPALTIEKGVIRQYLFGNSLAHILGYTGKLTQKELESFPDYFLAERIGKSGLEAIYEKNLRGGPGQRLVEVDAKGRQIKELGIKEELAGQNIITTIDLALQQKIFDKLSETLASLNLRKAAVVAIDPRNGQVLSLVSMPSFDNNLFEQSVSPSDLKKIFEDENQPLFNRAIAGQYAPGSLVKPLIGAAALQENVITPSTVINDLGSIKIINQYNPAIIYSFRDWKAHGLVNIYSAIAQSCDVYFYTIGGGYWNIEGLGIERIKKYFRLFGLGGLTGIDLAGEKNGLIPDANWKQEAKEERWFIGDTYNVSIGQGDLLITPIQMAVALGAIANGGKVFEPHLVDKIVDSDKNIIKVFEPQIIQKEFIESEYLAIIREGMREAVTSGTARTLNDLPEKVAAKTGTAQVAGQSRPNAWFVGFAPYEDPQIVLLVLIENAGEGSTIAVPLAKEIFEWYFSK